MVCLSTHRSSSRHTPWSLLSGYIGLALPEIPQTLSCLWVFRRKKQKTTIPLHYDVTPSFTLFRFLFKTISLDILPQRASFPPLPTCILFNPQAAYIFLFIFLQSIYCYLTLFLANILSAPLESKYHMRTRSLFCTSLLHTQCLENCLEHNR